MPGELGWIIITLVGALLIWLAWNWVRIYNMFVFLRTAVNRRYADIDILLQQRLDMLAALAPIVKKYNVHESGTLKDVIGARGKGIKEDAYTGSSIAIEKSLQSGLPNINAVAEQYPELQASQLHQSLLGNGSISGIEFKLKEVRMIYNEIAQDYNEQVKRFPKNIVAVVHGFTQVAYIQLGNKINYNDVSKKEKDYKPEQLSEDN